LTKKLTNMAFETSVAEFVETSFDYQRLSTPSPEHLSVDGCAPRGARCDKGDTP
jgi:hypothetical protein